MNPRTYGTDAEADDYTERRIDPDWIGVEADKSGWLSDRAADRYERTVLGR